MRENKIFCSVVIPTINRPVLSRAVHSVLNQDFHAAEFEVIVVNDTGHPLPEKAWQHSRHVQVITIQRRERSVARNTGAAIARGKYLYFLDDDDIMLPNALRALWELAEQTNARWLYGGYQVVDDEGQILEEFHPNLIGNISAFLIAGEAIPLQASLVSTDAFYAAGEFDVYFTGAQDRDLGRRISLRCHVAETSALITQIRVGQTKSSTAWAKLPEFDRLGREKALDQSNALACLYDSARDNKYLFGRVCRAYLASAAWNVKRRCIFKTASRLVSSATFGIPYILSPDFWKGLRTKIQPLGEIRRIKDPSWNSLCSIAVIITLLSILMSITLVIKRSTWTQRVILSHAYHPTSDLHR